MQYSLVKSSFLHSFYTTVHEVMPIPTYFAHYSIGSQDDNLVLVWNEICWQSIAMKRELFVEGFRQNSSLQPCSLIVHN